MTAYYCGADGEGIDDYAFFLGALSSKSWELPFFDILQNVQATYVRYKWSNIY